MSKFNFIRGFTELLQNTEVPEIFSVWSGIGAVSAALGRNVWIDQGVFTVYPNQFIVLVAGSGRCRKSTAVGMAEKLIRQLDPKPNIIAQKVTPEAMIQSLRVVHTDDPTALLRETCGGVVLADELSTFFNKRNYDAGLGPLLTSFWDCKDEFEYRTILRGVETIRNGFLTIIGGSTVEWIREAMPVEAIGGGVTSRFLFIYEDQPAPPVAFPKFTRAQKELQERLLRELQRIAMYHGEMTLEPSAERDFEKFYNDFYLNSPMFENKFLSGYASRRFVHLLKLSIVFCLMEHEGMTVRSHHLHAAQVILTAAEQKMAHVMNLISRTDSGDIVDEVGTVISSMGRISRRELIDQFAHRLSSKQFGEIMDTLQAAGRVQMVVDGINVMYQHIKST